jgi:antitoxin component YwqK of YwqJK toxin-antitoxin module
MLETYVLSDIIKYILNLYLDYENDIPKLENFIKVKFSIMPHITIEESYDNIGKYISERITYLDDILIKTERWYNNGQKWSENNFKNKKNHGVHRIFNPDGKIISEANYNDSKLDGRQLTVTGFYIVVKEYKNDIQNGKEYNYTSEGKLINELNYLNGKKMEFNMNGIIGISYSKLQLKNIKMKI